MSYGPNEHTGLGHHQELHDALHDVFSDVANLISINQTLRDALGAADNEKARLRDEIERLRERNNDSNFHQREKAKEISRLKGEVTIRDGRMQELEATLHNFENWKCAQENASLKTEVERLREERDAAVDALVGQARREYREALNALAEQEHA